MCLIDMKKYLLFINHFCSICHQITEMIRGEKKWNEKKNLTRYFTETDSSEGIIDTVRNFWPVKTACSLNQHKKQFKNYLNVMKNNLKKKNLTFQICQEGTELLVIHQDAWKRHVRIFLWKFCCPVCEVTLLVHQFWKK